MAAISAVVDIPAGQSDKMNSRRERQIRWSRQPRDQPKQPHQKMMLQCVGITPLLLLFATLPQAAGIAVNSTGGSFPANVYAETTFAYQFTQNADTITYFGPSSSVGKCNTMGYWTTLNTQPIDNYVSLAVKTADNKECTASLRPHASMKEPLVDIGASDSVLGATDYKYFPDLQMLPALAGAVVPVYNVKELGNTTLVLSRTSIVAIYIGKIQYWNDPRILADNKNNNMTYRGQTVQTILRMLNQKINPVLRVDSSGTTEIFSTSLARFDPIGSSSFATIAGTGGSTPTWCGAATDEVSTITLGGCGPSATASHGLAHIRYVDGSKTVRDITFGCNITAANLTTQFNTASVFSVIVNKNVTLAAAGIVSFSVGYADSSTVGKNWYKPLLVSATSGVTVNISTLQEGGYKNSHYTYPGGYTNPANYPGIKTPLILTLWLKAHTVPSLFTLSFRSINGTSYVTSTLNSSQVNATNLQSTLNKLTATVPTAVSSVVVSPHASWTEYQITFSLSQSARLNSFVATAVSGTAPSNVALFTFQDYRNYPIFYDSSHPRGYAYSGRYTCYMRHLNYLPWSYYTGSGNQGVIAEAFTRPYSIGYSVWTDARDSLMAMASLINYAGTTIVANSSSVSYAIMDQGGNLDPVYFTSILADGHGLHSWPMSGYTYFLYRKNHHLGSCTRRTAAMTYLYNYYFSTTVKLIASRLGYATLPDFIRDIVVAKLVSTAQCVNGAFALQKYLTKSIPLLTSTVLQNIVDRFLAYYNAIDPVTQWQDVVMENSADVWRLFVAGQVSPYLPNTYAAAFTLFGSKESKLYYFTQQVGIPTSITYAFTNIAVVPIYHLDEFTLNAPGSPQLRVTKDILVGIYTGTIASWNHTLLVQANGGMSGNGQYLPNKPIMVVVRGLSCDVNGVFLRYLAMNSPTFKSKYLSQYPTTGGGAPADYRAFNFSAFPSLQGRLINATENIFVDNNVIAQDGTFGYFLQVVQPTSNAALFCVDPTCSTQAPLNPSTDNGASLSQCALDTNTVVTSTTPGYVVHSLDLMSSQQAGCYPIVGTVDFTVYAGNNDSTCALTDSSGESVVQNKIKLGAFLFNGSAITNPLTTISATSLSGPLRNQAFHDICNEPCQGTKMGYKYCNYQDCTWLNGDYLQVVSSCNPSTQRRTVTYQLKNASDYSPTSCIRNPANAPPSSISIDCPYVHAGSSVAGLSIALCVIGILICGSILLLTLMNRQERLIKLSQPMFVFVFLAGAVLMNLTVLSMYGPNSDSYCMLRVWAFNLSSTTMFAPLIMKLHRVDVIYRASLSGERRKRSKMADYVIVLQVCVMVAVDILICLIWSVVDQPRQLTVNHTYSTVYDPVQDTVCSTGIGEGFEIAIVCWKALLLAIGVVKAISTWNVPEDISEAKYFAMAIYNIAVVGSFTYFLSVFGNANTETTVILRVIGIFVTSTVAAMVIMVPKLIAIKLSWTRAFFGLKGQSGFASSASQDGESESSPQQSKGVMGRFKQLRTGFKSHGPSHVIPMATGTGAGTVAPTGTGVGQTRPDELPRLDLTAGGQTGAKFDSTGLPRLDKVPRPGDEPMAPRETGNNRGTY